MVRKRASAKGNNRKALLRMMDYIERLSWPERAAEACGVTLRAWRYWRKGQRQPRPQQLERMRAVVATLKRARASGSCFDVGTLLTEEEMGELEVRP